MKDNKPHIDNLFEEKLGSRSFDFDERQWEKMAAVLDRQKRWGRIKLFSALALLITAGAFVAYNSNQQSTEIQHLSESNKTRQLEKLIPPQSSVDYKESILTTEINESKNVSKATLEDQLEEIRSSSVQKTIEIEASSTIDASFFQNDQSSEQQATLPGKNDDEETNNPIDNEELRDSEILTVTSAGQIDELGANKSAQLSEETDESDTNEELAAELLAIPLVDSKKANETLNIDAEQSSNMDETESRSEDFLSDSNSPLQADEVGGVVDKNIATSNEETAKMSLSTTTDSQFSEELTDINNWDPLTLKSLSSSTVEQNIIEPEAQTTEPYSTYVNRAYKLTYGIRAGVGLGSYSNDSGENGSSSSTAIYAGGFGAFQIHRRIILDAGISYSYQDLSMNTRIYHNVSYDFYKRDVQQQLFVNQLHILEFPLFVTYKVNPSHLVSIGAKFNYLMAVEGEAISTEIYGDQVTPLSTEKFTEGKGILEEMNWSLGFAYDYQFNTIFRIGVGADIGLNDWKIAGEFDNNQSFYNHQLRLRLTYLIKN